MNIREYIQRTKYTPEVVTQKCGRCRSFMEKHRVGGRPKVCMKCQRIATRLRKIRRGIILTNGISARTVE